MLNLMKSEWERMWARKKTKIGLFLFLFLLAFECFFLWGMGGRSFYDPEHAVHLNSLNTAPFLLREMAVYLNFILIPMLVVDSFNREYASGQLRMVLLRPLSYGKLLTAKWLVCSLLLLGINVLMWLAGTFFGKWAMPHAETVHFLNTGDYGPIGAFLFCMAFYGIAFLIFLAVLGVSTLISTLLPHPILSYVGIVIFLVGSVYVSSHLEFFLSVSDSIFHVLGRLEDMSLFGICAACAILGYGCSLWIWRRRNWTN